MVWLRCSEIAMEQYDDLSLSLRCLRHCDDVDRRIATVRIWRHITAALLSRCFAQSGGAVKYAWEDMMVLSHEMRLSAEKVRFQVFFSLCKFVANRMTLRSA
jgi:hypothetical protein